MFRTLTVIGALSAGAAQADIEVTFRDGAPKDTFRIEHTGGCALPSVSLLIDLAPSPAGLIFDVSEAGGGVEVFQPFEVTQGADLIAGVSAIKDGDQSVQLDLGPMPAQATIAFTTDLDDTIGAREITVSGAEIAGARIVLGTELEVIEGVFDNTGLARVAVNDCLS